MKIFPRMAQCIWMHVSPPGLARNLGLRGMGRQRDMLILPCLKTRPHSHARLHPGFHQDARRLDHWSDERVKKSQRQARSVREHASAAVPRPGLGFERSGVHRGGRSGEGHGHAEDDRGRLLGLSSDHGPGRVASRSLRPLAYRGVWPRSRRHPVPRPQLQEFRQRRDSAAPLAASLDTAGSVAGLVGPDPAEWTFMFVVNG